MKTYEVDIEGKTYEVDAPDPGTAWQWANAHVAQTRQATTRQRADAETERKRLLKEEAASMSTGQRALANVGAGLNNLYTGARQLFGAKIPDEEIRAMRERNDALAESSDMGVLPDWMPTAGKALQVAGEVAPTLVVPAGGFVRGAQAAGRGAQALTRTLAGSAPSAGRAAASTAGRMGSAAAAGDAALAGAASGALMPTLSTESRGLNTALGAAGGAALPGAVAAVRGARESLAIGQGGRQLRAGRRLVQTLGDDASRVADDLEQRAAARTGAARNVPLSAAELSQDPRLALLEREAAARDGAGWTQFRIDQNTARGSALGDIARRAEADRIDELADGRDALTAPLREEALARAAKYSEMHTPLYSAAEDLMQRSVPGSAQRALAKLMQSTLDEAPDPAKLYEFRKLLASKLSGPSVPGDEVAAITKGAQRETMALIQAIDDRIDEASSGRWRPYLDLYQGTSAPVNNARAVNDVLEGYLRDGAPQVGALPEITRTNLGRAMDRAGDSPFGDRFMPQTRQDLEDVLGTLRDSEIQRTVRGATTSGGGSDTRSRLAFAAADVGMGSGGALTAAREGARIGIEREQEYLSAALRDPIQTAQAIRAKLAQGQPLTDAEKRVLVMLRSATPAAALGLAPQQQQ